MIEHVDDPVALLERLESLADIVVVNFLEPSADDPHLHKPLPIAQLLDRCAARELLHYSVHHGRSHLVAYRGQPAHTPLRRLRSVAWRAAGPHSRAVAALRVAEHWYARVRPRRRAMPRADRRVLP